MASKATIAQKHEQFQTDYMTLTVSWDDLVAGRVSSQMQAAMTAVSADLMEQSRDRAPVRSRHLIDNTGVEMNSAGDTWTLRYTMPYARRQHYGHPTGGRWRGMRSGTAPRGGWGIRARSSIPSRRMWLANTLREAGDDFDRLIAARVRL